MTDLFLVLKKVVNEGQIQNDGSIKLRGTLTKEELNVIADAMVRLIFPPGYKHERQATGENVSGVPVQERDIG